MTHEGEKTYSEKVEESLIDIYGEENVHSQVTLPVSQRRVDFHVETPDESADLAIEVENDFESVFAGVGQTTVYADQLDARPMVFVPPGHIKVPEVFHLTSRGVDVFQYPVGDGK